jgi:hypothetical protein
VVVIRLWIDTLVVALYLAVVAIIIIVTIIVMSSKDVGDDALGKEEGDEVVEKLHDRVCSTIERVWERVREREYHFREVQQGLDQRMEKTQRGGNYRDTYS